MKAIGDAALRAFERFERPILPITSGAKFPPRLKWKVVDEEGHTTYAGLDTEEAIREWWSKNPDDNYAILTGGDLVVVDIDVKGSDNGFDAMALLTWWDQATFAVDTPSGGRHLYYDTKGNIVRTFRGFKPGVDIKGQGGYVLGPGSALDGIGEYVIVDDAEMLPAPERLLDNNWLSACSTTTLLMAAHSGGGHAIGVTEEWQAVWRKLSTDYLHHGRSFGKVELPSFGEGQRHNALLSCFGYLRNQPGWHSFEQWEGACEWVADQITFPSLRMTAPDDFHHLVHDIWAKEDEPKPFDPFEHRNAKFEAMLDENPLYRSMQFAPDYSTDDEIEWIVQDIVPKRSITAVAALFKTGKSEFVSSLVRLITTGTKFLDRETTKSRVLYLTEERQGTFQIKTDRYGFGYDVGIIHRSKLLAEESLSWEVAVDKAIELCAAQEFGVLVVDTFTRWANLTDENSNAEITKKMTPLEKVAGAGVAVIIIHQHGKSTERQHGLSMRGASAFGDAVDVFCELYRPKNGHSPEQRILTVTGRINEFRFTVQFDPNLGYFFVSDDTGTPPTQQSTAKEDRREDIRFILSLRGDVTADIVVEDGQNWNRNLASKYLNEMVRDGELVKETRGREVWFKEA